MSNPIGPVDITVSVPADLAPRVFAAVRGNYASLAPVGASDEEVAASAVAYLLQQVLVGWEKQQARAPLAEELAAIKDRYEKAVDKAEKDAAKDAAKIVRKGIKMKGES